ncbi:MAG: hypothetical protein HKUEN01_33800 [Candidatus Kuenenia stuttgartiensis]|uniref:LIC12162 family transferase n=1 Tax=Kuenenia stuttgartiensis TaxID=174633 RepID=UPI00146A83FF|nr:LIC12162 family protein [Candidatus Kuenenia stuttgartiensis]GJQ50994.1 MAG: hypothetical protein HKUEN01_33800 [Candidatus Kuenenia stuttgartiensis]
MFLATTALEEFWDKSQKIVFLGEWCKLYDRKNEWDKLEHETLPYHWDDRQKLYSDYLYLNELSEKILEKLTERLNYIHSVSYPVRYWRIIFGWWLHMFVEILYDRYESIKVAERYGKVKNTYISYFKPGSWTPKDYNEFSPLSISDGYNYYIYSKIIEFIERLPYTVVDTLSFNKKLKTYSNIQTNSINLKTLLKSIAKRTIRVWDKIVPSSLNRIVFVSSYFSLTHQFMLQLRLGQIPYFGKPFDFEALKFDFDPDIRKRLSLNMNGNEFEKLLTFLLPEQFPFYYLEGYGCIKQKALNSYPKNPKVIFTANASFNNELFKLWSSHYCYRGSKLVHTQHGGAKGIWLFAGDEEYELKIADIYYSWGWENKEDRTIKPMPSPMLAGTQYLNYHKEGRILLVECALPRYSYWIGSASIAASGYNVYIEDQFRFIKTLSGNARKLLLVRLYMHDYGNSQRKRFEDMFPNVEYYNGSKSVYKQLSKSRLFIGSYNGTTYLQTLSANFPTILFWKPSHWELRETAKPYFNELHRVGILHDTPESAAAKVNEIYEYPIDWWQQSEVQRTRLEFCEMFARTSKKWIDEWVKEFNKVLSKI